MTRSMVSATHVSRSYPSPAGPVAALIDINFEIPSGSFIALVGRSGSGKTTLLNCLGGLDRPDQGEIFVNGHNVTSMKEDLRAKLRRDDLAYVFQTFGLVPMLSAAENVGLPMRLRRVPNAERRERVASLLAQVGLSAQAEQRPEELSGGQQQRVAIARALANRPRLLIADEPTGQLDAASGAEIIALIRSLVISEGMTAIISTHDHSARDLADNTLTLADGRATWR